MRIPDSIYNAFDIELNAENFVLVENRNSESNPFIRIELEKANIYKADAIYCKPFTKNKLRTFPVAYFYNNSENKLNIAEIHKNLWNAGIVSIFVVFDKLQIKIFNARKPVDVVGNQIIEVPLIESIALTVKAKEILEEKNLVSQYLDSEYFHDFYKSEFVEKNSPHFILLNRSLNPQI